MPKELLPKLKKIKEWIQKNKVLDIIIFGSAMRGKTSPNDIDLCILIKEKDTEKSLELVDSLGKLAESIPINAHINILSTDKFASGNSLVKTLMNEGLSLKTGNYFCNNFDFQNKSLFIYTLKKFSPSKRVKFHYLLRGRYGRKGILDEIQGKFLGTGTIIISTEKEDLLKEIFETWTVDYKIERILLS